MVKAGSKRDSSSKPSSLIEALQPWASACLLGYISLIGEMKIETVPRVAVRTKLKNAFCAHGECSINILY